MLFRSKVRNARYRPCACRPAGAHPDRRNHFVNGRPLKGPYPAGSEQAIFAFGCYWGAETAFWSIARASG